MLYHNISINYCNLTKTGSVLSVGALGTLRAAELLRERVLGTQLAERGPVPVHAGGTPDAGVVPGLPARRTLARRRRLLHRRAVRDKPVYLPVNPAVGAEVGRRSVAELLVEHVTDVAHRRALFTLVTVDARHAAVGDLGYLLAQVGDPVPGDYQGGGELLVHGGAVAAVGGCPGGGGRVE